MFNKAIQILKEKLQTGYNKESENVSFQEIWDSFPLHKEVDFKGKKVTCVERGAKNIDNNKKRFVILKGKMPKGSIWFKNHHTDAREIFIPILGKVTELITTINLDSYSKPLVIRPGVPHSFKATTEFEFISKIYEE